MFVITNVLIFVEYVVKRMNTLKYTCKNVTCGPREIFEFDCVCAWLIPVWIFFVHCDDWTFADLIWIFLLLCVCV